MERFGPAIVSPSIQQICDVNRRMIEDSGGYFSPPDNLHNFGSLEHVLAIVALPIFGQDLYPTLKEKAAVIMHHIITGHVFMDGNKRTAVHIAWEFLRSNNVPVFLEPTIADLAVAIATGQANHLDLLSWFHMHQGDSAI